MLSEAYSAANAAPERIASAPRPEGRSRMSDLRRVGNQLAAFRIPLWTTRRWRVRAVGVSARARVSSRLFGRSDAGVLAVPVVTPLRSEDRSRVEEIAANSDATVAFPSGHSALAFRPHRCSRPGIRVDERRRDSGRAISPFSKRPAFSSSVSTTVKSPTFSTRQAPRLRPGA